MTDPGENQQEPAIPAATLVLFRDHSDRQAEHLMIERAGHVSFAAGALVFPGGRVEREDTTVAEQAALTEGTALDADDAAARVAVVRETIEETGVAVAIKPAPLSDTVRQWRATLAENGSFAALLATAGARIDFDQLVPFARWCPKLKVAKRYDTRFYLALAQDDPMAEVDHGEALSHVWLSAQAALDSANAGRHQIIFPTRRNLERLAAHPAFAAATAHARATPMQVITPWVQQTDGVDWLCLPEDAGYPVTGAPLTEALKGVG